MSMYYWLAVHVLYFNTAGDLKQWKVSDLFAVDPKLVVKEALALQELTDHGLTGRKIPIL